MDKEKLERLKEKLNYIKNTLGIPVLSIALIISIVSCHNKGKNNNDYSNEYTSEAISEMTSEEITEAITTQEVSSEYIPEVTSEEITSEEISTSTNVDNDTIILDEFNEYNEEVKELIDKEDIENAKAKGREYFIKYVDFIFYGSTINGITYDELKEESKQELFNELCQMDELISTVSPDYKENLSEKYTLVKDFTKEKYYYSLDKIKEYIGEEKYEEIGKLKDDTKEKITNFKDEHQDEIDSAKEIIDNKTDEYKLKLKNWYEDYKEE